MSRIVNMIFIILILISFMVSGYHAQNNINDLAYVVAIGVDVRRTKRSKNQFSALNPFEKCIR